MNKNLKDYTLDIKAVPPETQDVMMESGDAKVASGGYYRTPRREKDYIVPNTPIGASSVMIYVLKENQNKFSDLEDAVKNGKQVPNTPNGGIYKVLTDWNAAHDNIMKEIPIQDGLTVADRLQSLKTGQYDFMVYPDNFGVEETAKAMGIEIVTVGKPIKVNEIVVIVNKKEEKLAAEIDAALKNLLMTVRLPACRKVVPQKPSGQPERIEEIRNGVYKLEAVTAIQKPVRRQQSNRFFASCHIAAFLLSHTAFLPPLRMTLRA